MKCRKVGFRAIPTFDGIEGIEVASGGDILISLSYRSQESSDFWMEGSLDRSDKYWFIHVSLHFTSMT